MITYLKLVGMCKGVYTFMWAAMHVCASRPESHLKEYEGNFQESILKIM